MGLNWRRTDNSSFITAIAWVPTQEEHSGLCLIDIRGKVYAYLTPPWVYGLLCSAEARGTSVGRVYSRVLRGQFPRVEAEA